MSVRPKLLDLFCCEGGASEGYRRAGFDVYGVDLFMHANDKGRRVGFSQKRYLPPSYQGDVISTLRYLLSGPTRGVWFAGYLMALRDFDAIHASPPCQRHTAGTRAGDRSGYPDLIGPTRDLLIETGLPYVIENVEGAPLRDPLLLCGTMFGLSAVDDDGTPLEMWRHRMFESNADLAAPVRPLGLYGFTDACHHGWHSDQVAGSYGGARRDKHEARDVRHGGYVPSKAVQQRLLGIDWMTERGLHQAVPPAYTEHIGRQLLAHVLERAA